MTGFGTAEGPLAGGRLVLEIRTVNHRHFNPVFRLPSALLPFEGELRDALRRRLERGSVTVTAHWTAEPPATRAVHVDVERARSVVAALGELKQALNLAGEIDLAFVARLPEVVVAGNQSAVAIEWEELRAILERTLHGVLAMREREGEALARDVGERVAALETALGRVEARAPERRVAEHARLRQAVADLLGTAPVDAQRLAQEVALYADRVDIAEEIVRLKSHLAAVREALVQAGVVGRRLAFLGQEVLREVNTIGSKANDAEIARAVIAMKEETEKLREQVENLE